MDSHKSPLRVVSLESRQAAEMTRLLERHGCASISAPSMREVAIEDQREVLAFGEQLMSGQCDVLVLLTGVGTKLLIDALAARWSMPRVLLALAGIQLVCRGPKPAAVLKGMGLRPAGVADEPNTWQDLLALLGGSIAVAGQQVVVQDYGQPSVELCAALAQRGARVQALPIYAWALPLNLAPLRAAIETLCRGEADAVLFTSRRQIDHLLQVAQAAGLVDALREALLRQVLVVSIGPVTTQALVEHGLQADLVPAHPKMGHMVQTVAKEGAAAVVAKRTRAAT
ncbi:MAG TPA: uroporphyrinogen-III synthase [Polyangiales bacterium]